VAKSVFIIKLENRILVKIKRCQTAFSSKGAEVNLSLALEFDKKRISWYNIPTIISKSKEAIK